ncbi:dihydrodipicolinate synthase family protein [Citricoccus sp. K5]|uniref:dihydrodipicolinate synthase family protein n=1 Tax=Citricoccus sp. K5 TaxID=2653135 RepID=UPI0012F00ADB|nr:dihydrodipicolinate synthase family protein [Citricoccus sp. K5]VXB08462.1 Dihydrodipicolinate synthase [Citricoccus sp. K5]
MFTGLSAFPLTPLRHDALDEPAFIGLVERLVAAGVDSITALGSTGSYAYLDRDERARVARAAVAHAGDVPVFVGIGATRTSQVLAHAEAAQEAGAAGLLLAPVSYQPLTEEDVFELFRTVTSNSSVPVIVYDNPGTTRFTFTMELYARIAALGGIESIKIPGVPADPESARTHIQQIRDVIPAEVTIGVSGDAHAADGLLAGCDVWYSVIAGTLPEAALRIVRAVRQGSPAEARAESQRLVPLWELFARHGGSIRVMAAVAEQLGLAQESSLPLPLLGLTEAQRAEVARVIEVLGLKI